jgi:glucosamine-6-phosphate deaminase
VGLEETNPQSYRYFMNQNLFSKIDLPLERTHVPSGKTASAAEADEYESLIQAAAESTYSCSVWTEWAHRLQRAGHTVWLDHAFGAPLRKHPPGKRAVLCIDGRSSDGCGIWDQNRDERAGDSAVCAGEIKANIIRKAIYGSVTEAVPASVLQLHPNVTLYLDAEAAKYL